LDKASERSFQVPFCYMLSRQGYTIVHISSHNAMELGKDVLAVDKKGTPCAFQLKGGDVSLRKWRDEVAPQVRDLAYGTVTHPDGEKQTEIDRFTRQFATNNAQSWAL
jgi:hypothetical protein